MVASAYPIDFLPTGFMHLPGGYTTEYVDAGSGPAIVLIPGLAGGIDLLEPFIRELSRRHRVIAYELPGEDRGLFDRRVGWQQLIDDLDGVITGLGLERPGLVGLSFGGAIALKYAARRSARLGFLSVQGIGSRFRAGLIGQITAEVLHRLPLPENNAFVNQVFRLLMGHADRPRQDFDFVVNRCWQTDQSVIAHRFTLLNDFDMENCLPGVWAPTLVLSGEADVVVPPPQARELARAIPQAEFFIVPGAGHLAFVTDAAQVTRHIEQFATGCRAF